MKNTAKIDTDSMDIKEVQAKKLKQLFPDIFNEEKVDFEKLKLSLGENIDIGRERYGMNWPGKAQAIKVAQLPSNATLKPDEKASVDFDKTQNLFIEGDNLEVLKLLQKSYFGKIKMCYLDPPYNTGKEFIYPDKYEEGLQTYLQYTGQIDAEGKKFSTNVESDGRFHSKWMNMMWPRLFLARNLLTEDGVIFISIDDHEVDNLIKICDEVFGEENLIANFAWRKTDNQPNIGNTARVKEYVLCFCKNNNALTINKMRLTERAKREYRYEDDNGKYRRSNLIDKTRGRFDYEIKTPSGKILNGPWMIKNDDFASLLDAKRIYWASGEEETPYGKIYLNESEGQISNDWLGIEFGTNQEAGLDMQELFNGLRIFDFPKPVSLIKHFVTIGSNKNDIVLDIFAGSGTSAHSVMQLNSEDGGNRKFIMVQLPEKTDENSEAYKAGYKDITEIGEERIRRAGKKISEENKDKEGFDAKKFDKGFKVFKLDRSNFSVWDGSTDGDIQKKLELHVNNTNPKNKEVDILYEILVKAGFELAEKIEEIKIAGKNVYSVSGGQLLICLDKVLDKDFVRSLAEKKPKQFICLNSSFKEDADLTNTAKILENNQIEFRTI